MESKSSSDAAARWPDATNAPGLSSRAIVTDGMKDDVVNAIIRGARSPGDGEVGDGKIFVTQVEDVIRVRTGESGEIAI